MFKTTSETLDPTQDSTIHDDVITGALQTQLSLVTTFDQWLQQHIDSERDYQKVASIVKTHLDSYKQCLVAAQSGSSTNLEALKSWEIHATIEHTGKDGGKIIVTGPALPTAIEIETEDEEKANYVLSDQYLGYMVKACHALCDAQKTIQSLLKSEHDVMTEKARLSQPAEMTVQTHIRCLKEYNDMKDIGQQLIGLIAENRGIPIGGLYEDGQYGVTADD